MIVNCWMVDLMIIENKNKSVFKMKILMDEINWWRVKLVSINFDVLI